MKSKKKENRPSSLPKYNIALKKYFCDAEILNTFIKDSLDAIFE